MMEGFEISGGWSIVQVNVLNHCLPHHDVRLETQNLEFPFQLSIGSFRRLVVGSDVDGLATAATAATLYR